MTNIMEKIHSIGMGIGLQYIVNPHMQVQRHGLGMISHWCGTIDVLAVWELPQPVVVWE